MTRTDKWLWAARFFKTRAKAKEAIEGGKVHVNGQRAKPAKELSVDDELVIRQGYDEKTVTVLKLSDQRRGAPEAQLLYQESAESLEKRETLALQRKSAGQHLMSKTKPNKKERRQIHQFRDRPG